jgi:isocitrate dehydrogenase
MVAKEQFGAEQLAMSHWLKVTNPKSGEDIVIKDLSLNSMIQQCLTRPAEYQVVVAENETSEILSSLLNAQTGNIGITPQVHFNNDLSVFEACHGTALKYAGLNKVNPSSVILAAEMMLRHIGWVEAADKIVKGMSQAIAKGHVTYDLERKVANSTLVSCSQFGDSIIEQINLV